MCGVYGLLTVLYGGYGYFTICLRLFYGYFTVILRLFYGYFTAGLRLFTVIVRLYYGWTYGSYRTGVVFTTRLEVRITPLCPT